MAHKLSTQAGGHMCGDYLSRVGHELMKVYNDKDPESFLKSDTVPTAVRDYVGFCYAQGYL